jgi:hypothetical protein
MARHPRRIDVGSIDEIATTRHKGVEHGKGTVAVCGPPQHIAPKTNRGDIQAGTAHPTGLHDLLLVNNISLLLYTNLAAHYAYQKRHCIGRHALFGGTK